MRYSESWVDTAVTGHSDIGYRINSVYDPYYGAGGGACWGIDEIQALYSSYIVRNATIYITASVPSGTAATDITLVESEIAALSATTEVLGHPEAKTMHLTPGVVQTLVAKADMSKLSPNQFAVYSAHENANPDICFYWHIWTRNSAGSTNAINLNVTIDYDTEWWQLKPLDAGDA